MLVMCKLSSGQHESDAVKNVVTNSGYIHIVGLLSNGFNLILSRFLDS